MMMYSAGTRGFYSTEIHTDIPADAVEVSDRAYAELIEAQNSGKAIEPDGGGRPVAVGRSSVPPVAARTLKSDVWRRCTDEEAEAADAALKASPVKMQRLWADSTILEHESPEFALVLDFMTEAFGAERAAVILAPSAGV